VHAGLSTSTTLAPAVLAVAAGIAALADGPPASTRAVVVFSGPAPGGRYSARVVMEPGDTEANERVRGTIDQETALAAHTFSGDDTRSALARFNAIASTEPVPVPAELVEAAFTARRVAERTGGAYDPTGTPGGFELLSIVPSHLTLAKGQPGLTLDLDGLAGGWLADRIAGAVAALGYRGVLAAVGGGATGRGRRPDGSHWHVATGCGDRQVEGPLVVQLDDAAVVTAVFDRPSDRGGAQDRLVDPRTGKAATRTLASATVVHPDGVTAAAFARALLVLGAEEGRAVVERERLAACLVERRPDGSRSEWSSASFDALVVN
jgi:thiamine biosynthesis lipoprotein